MTSHGLNLVDIIIIVIFLISIILGVARGFVSEMLSILVLLVSFVVAVIFTDSLASYFSQTSSVQSAVANTSSSTGTDTQQTASYMIYGLSFLVLFLGTFIVGSIFKYFLNLVLLSGVLGAGNRIMGGVFGIIRGYLVNLLLIFVVQLSPLSAEAAWQQSRLVPFFQPQIAWLAARVSPMLDNIKTTFNVKANGDQNAE